MLPIHTIREVIRINTIFPDLSDRKVAKLALCSHQSVGRLKKKIKQLAINHAIALQFKDKELAETLYPRIHGSDTSRREPDYVEHYKQSLKKNGKSKTVLYLEYRAKDSETALSKSQYFAKVRKYLKKCRLAMRQQHLAGEVVYIDYAGTKISYEKDGKKVWLKVFVGVLGASKKIFAFATPGERTVDWINGINRMFEYFGGVTQVISIDNAKALVTKAGVIPILNKNIALLGEHYGCIIDGCRVGKPQDKSLAELGVKFVTQRVLRPMNQDLQFFSIDEVNAFLAQEVEWLNNLPLQKLNITRNELCKQTDEPALRPGPSRPFVVVDDFKVVKVPADYHIEYDNHYYSVPYTLAHEEVEVIVTNTHLKVVHQHQVEAMHQLSNEINASSTLKEHLSPAHESESAKTKDEYMKWASEVGVSTETYVEQQYGLVDNHKSRAIGKRIQNLMKLCKGKDLRQIESACDYAIQNEVAPNEMGMVFKMLDYVANKTPALMKSTTHQNIRGKAAFGGSYDH